MLVWLPIVRETILTWITPSGPGLETGAKRSHILLVYSGLMWSVLGAQVKGPNLSLSAELLNVVSSAASHFRCMCV